MYLTHFGLSREPFSIAPDPHYLFMSHRHREALAHLLFGVNGVGESASSGGFVLLTGDIGTGKTTVCRCFLAQVPAGCQVAYIFNPKLTVPELLQTIGEEFHLWPQNATHDQGPGSHTPSPKAAVDALNAFLLRSHAAGQQCVLVIDEAQHLSTEVLEQLRLLTNLETNERKLLQIVLIGQPELRELLARPELEQLAQRVVARFHLDALNEGETAQYIAHRMQVAGLSGPVPLEPQALQRIHQLSGGVPRRINLLCGRALLGAWTLGQPRVSLPVVQQAAREVFGNPPPAGRDTPTRRWWAPWSHAGLPEPQGVYRRGGSALGLLRGGLVAAVVASVVAGVVVMSGLATVELGPSHPATAAVSTATSAPDRVPGPNGEPATSSSGSGAPQPGKPTPPQPGQAQPADLAQLLPQWPTDPEAAWPELARLWQAEATGCTELLAQGHACYRTTRLTLPLLRQLDRPGMLTLHPGDLPRAPATSPTAPASPPPAHHAVLVGLGDTTATLQWQGQRHTVHLVALVQAWRGDYATLWQPPPGFGERLADGATGPAVARLSQWLNALDGHTPTALPVLDGALSARVRAFQAAHGLTPDGRPGPMTFMQLERAAGASAVRLSTP